MTDKQKVSCITYGPTPPADPQDRLTTASDGLDSRALSLLNDLKEDLSNHIDENIATAKESSRNEKDDHVLRALELKQRLLLSESLSLIARTLMQRSALGFDETLSLVCRQVSNMSYTLGTSALLHTGLDQNHVTKDRKLGASLKHAPEADLAAYVVELAKAYYETTLITDIIRVHGLRKPSPQTYSRNLLKKSCAGTPKAKPRSYGY